MQASLCKCPMCLHCTCIQSIRCQQKKLWFKLNSPFMHYLRTQNPYEEVKKWLSSKCCHFQKKTIFMVSNVQCVYIVCAKYQMQTGKVLIQVEFPVPALSENTKSIMKKKSEKKILSSKCCHFVKKLLFQYLISSCKCSRCLHCVSKLSDANSKSSATS